MAKAKQVADDMPFEAMLLGCQKDRYKISYAALRWAKEIKKVENLPDPIPLLVPRALREIVTGKVSIKEIEKLPYLTRPVSTPAPQNVPPTLTLNVAPAEPKAEKE